MPKAALCEICQAATNDVPVVVTFQQRRKVQWILCDACTLVITNYIKKMARKSEATTK